MRLRLAGAMTLVLLLAAGRGTWPRRAAASRARRPWLPSSPAPRVAAERVFLTRAQRRAIGDLARVDDVSGLVARYVATRGGAVVGRAYVDTHVVRTKRESLLISLHADGTVKRIDVTAFLEPIEYLPSERWLAQYDDRPLDDDLALRRAIRTIAGATLSGVATNAAVRRVLATDQVLARARGRVSRPRAPARSFTAGRWTWGAVTR